MLFVVRGVPFYVLRVARVFGACCCGLLRFVVCLLSDGYCVELFLCYVFWLLVVGSC